LLDEETTEILRNDELKGSIASNENYLLYNDSAIELAIANATEVLSRSYNMNEIVRDQEKIQEMEIREKERLLKKNNLRAKIQKLKDKLFNELIFDVDVEEKIPKAIPEQNIEIVSQTEENKNSTSEIPDTIDISVRPNDFRRRVSKNIKFSEKNKLIHDLKAVQTEFNNEEVGNERLDPKFKVLYKVELIYPDKKPTNKKITELDIQEEKRKHEYLEEEKKNEEKYSNFDPSDKLHEYFSKTLKENEKLIADPREREEIDKYLTYAPPVRQYYDNLALLYEEIENAKGSSRKIQWEIKDLGEEEVEDENDVEDELDIIYQYKQKVKDYDAETYFQEMSERMETNKFFAPVIYQIERSELLNQISNISNFEFDSDSFNQSVKKAISDFEARKEKFQILEDVVSGLNYEDYLLQDSGLVEESKLKAETERREHIQRNENPIAFQGKLKLVEDRPFPKQLNRREKRKRSFLVDGKKVVSIPPPRRNKDDPVREKDNRKPRDVKKENARLMSNVVRQNLKNIQITDERAKLIKERYISYFGHYRVLMYPDGFRHLENYNVYKFVFPDKSLNDYQNERKLLYLI